MNFSLAYPYRFEYFLVQKERGKKMANPFSQPEKKGSH